MKKPLGTYLRILVSLSFIVILLYIMRDKYGDILKVLKGTDIFIFLLGLLVFMGAVTLASLRLKFIVNAQDIAVNFPDSVSLTFIGYFFNNFLPTAIGGDVAKAYYLAKKSGSMMGSFTSVFVDRFVGLVTMILMAFIALLFAGDRIKDPSVRIIICVITAGSLVAVIFMTNKAFANLFSVFFYFIRPFEERLRRIYNSVNMYKHHKILMAQSVSISIVSQLLFFSSLGIMGLSIGSKIPVMDILLRMPIISTLSLLPSINGLGLREGATVVFFAPLIGSQNAFALGILWLLVLFIVSLIGGIIYSVSPQFRINFKDIKTLRQA